MSREGSELSHQELLDLEGTCPLSHGTPVFFIFCVSLLCHRSNSGAQRINQEAQDFRDNGRDREEIQLQDLESKVALWSFSNQSPFWHSSVIDKNLVDAYVPFLPLEFKHVVQCVLAEMESRGRKQDQNVAKRMAQDMMPTNTGFFCTKGCKTISNRLDYYI
ncbi:torsin-1A-like [Engraulis encrasicolus]|uniref:torsin-1A-like n=1 Tax=Engraulis encrasicolus TaxID=184585 RepID=UPI002FD1CD82